jgi:hypothetical protein
VFPLKEDGTLADFPLKEGEESVHTLDRAEKAQIKALAVIENVSDASKHIRGTFPSMLPDLRSPPSIRIAEINWVAGGGIIKGETRGVPHRISREETSALRLVVARSEVIESGFIDALATPGCGLVDSHGS